LLRNGTGNIPADWCEVTDNHQVSFAAYYALYERRLLPCLRYANEFAQAKGVNTIITLPGLGCGQFAGKFKGQLGAILKPLLKGNEGKGQLCLPADYEDIKGEFSDCTLTSFVAWDHVSWPGNDFYIGSRATDDGVKAAATSTMAVMTSCSGQYSVDSNLYQPPDGYQTWGEVVTDNAITLICNSNLKIE
jgi:hypothetical protein